MTAERTYTLQEAAQLAGVTLKALTRRVERGVIPHHKEGGLRRIRHEDLHRFYPQAVPADPGEVGEGHPPAPPEPVREKGPRRPRDPELTDVVLALTTRLEHLSGELSTHRLLATQADNRARMAEQTREAHERELLEARAKATELEAVAKELRRQLQEAESRGRPGWFRRMFGAQGGHDGGADAGGQQG